MMDNLIWFAYFCFGYNCIFLTYLVYKEFFRNNPLTFLEIFLYIESVFERLEKADKDSIQDIKNNILNSELRTQDQFRETIKSLKDDSAKNKK